jgi:phosphoglycerate kinase
MADFLTLDDVDVRNKTVLLRIDINVPYDEKSGKICDSDKLKEHAKTIKELSDKGAKLVLLSHQGREGDPDFIHLEQHSKLLKKHVGKKVSYVDDVIGERAKKKIKSLGSENILLLDNVRFLADEIVEKSADEHKESEIVKNLSPLADVFINDAFSASHRSHASVVGFTSVLPSYAGRVMATEVKKLKSILVTMKISKHDTFVIGGAKPKEPLDVVSYMLEEGTLEKVFVAGIVGELFLIAKGYDLGASEDYLQKRKYIEFLPQAKELLEKYKDKIEIPTDIAIDFHGIRKDIPVQKLPTNHLILDIGSKTIEKYIKIIKDSVTIGFKGPTGKYEEEGFDVGTGEILNAISDSKAISLIGGGHTLEALDKFNIDKSKFTHVSLGGGALIKFLSGKPMPAIEALKTMVKK